ncbi:MAG: hypothetical protein QOK40_2179 [Miltoncostaeaceae bacterium]|nr:hypothetical protein [Miltoncostaeaceae bacterium]
MFDTAILPGVLTGRPPAVGFTGLGPCGRRRRPIRRSTTAVSRAETERADGVSRAGTEHPDGVSGSVQQEPVGPEIAGR